MTREEHLKYCKICESRRFDNEEGIVCALTGKIADFENNCESFVENTVLVRKYEEIEKNTSFDEASLDKRFANLLLDSIILFIINFMFSLFIGLLLIFTSPLMFDKFTNLGLFGNYLIGFVIGTIYYTLFEMYFGRTLGKFITKTKVVSTNGDKPSLNVIFIRTLCRYIPFEAFSYLGSSKSGWHDKLSGTKVING